MRNEGSGYVRRHGTVYKEEDGGTEVDEHEALTVHPFQSILGVRRNLHPITLQ